MKKKATLLLEDGRVFRGSGHGFEGEAVGEVVFNTSMTGYQEILTDPSYAGQIVTMTYPLIGNYGINSEDIESRRPFADGIVGLSEIDTRALVRHIRERGAMRACLSSIDLDEQSLIEKARRSPEMIG